MKFFPFKSLQCETLVIVQSLLRLKNFALFPDLPLHLYPKSERMKVKMKKTVRLSVYIYEIYCFLTASPSPNVRYYPPPPPPSATHLPNTITTRVDVPSDRIDSTALSLVSAVSSIPEIVRSVLNIFDQFVNIFDHQVGPGSHLGRRVGRLAQPEHPHTSCA